MSFYYTADVSRFLDCTDWQKFEGHIVSVVNLLFKKCTSKSKILPFTIIILLSTILLTKKGI